MYLEPAVVKWEVMVAVPGRVGMGLEMRVTEEEWVRLLADMVEAEGAEVGPAEEKVSEVVVVLASVVPETIQTAEGSAEGSAEGLVLLSQVA